MKTYFKKSFNFCSRQVKFIQRFKFQTKARVMLPFQPALITLEIWFLLQQQISTDFHLSLMTM